MSPKKCYDQHESSFTILLRKISIKANDMGDYYCENYTLNKSSKWYIVYICRVFQKGLIVDKFFL